MISFVSIIYRDTKLAARGWAGGICSPTFIIDDSAYIRDDSAQNIFAKGQTLPMKALEVLIVSPARDV